MAACGTSDPTTTDDVDAARSARLVLLDPVDGSADGLDGAEVSGNVEIALDANGNIDEVAYFLGDASEPLYVADASPFSFTLDTTALPDGPTTLEARAAKPRKGFRSVASASFAVANAVTDDEVPTDDGATTDDGSTNDDGSTTDDGTTSDDGSTTDGGSTTEDDPSSDDGTPTEDGAPTDDGTDGGETTDDGTNGGEATDDGSAPDDESTSDDGSTTDDGTNDGETTDDGSTPDDESTTDDGTTDDGTNDDTDGGTTEPDPEGVVTIVPGDDAVALVATAPAGTEFVFETGVHRIEQPLVPDDGDIFRGMQGAVLNGARLLTNPVRRSGLWAFENQSQEGWFHGTCSSEAPRCDRVEELFLDGKRLRHAASLGEVGPGAWYFDYASDTIFMGDDPSGHQVETSIASAAISGDADEVTVRDLTIEMFANAAQRGAVMADRIANTKTYGRDWTIVNNVVRLNHGVGIRAGWGADIVGNTVTANGQLGISSVGGRGTLIERNEIADNNAVGFNAGWEAGGTKFVRTEDLLVRDNYVHHNDGPGLWTDIDNVGTRYEGNLVEFNAGNGIFHEISYDAVIVNNVVRGNGVNAGEQDYAYVYGAGIMVANSPDVEVAFNTVEGNWNGIVGLHQNRGSGAYGPWEVRNLHVHDNYITMTYHEDGIGPQGETGVPAVTGLSQAGGFNQIFGDDFVNAFVSNDYVVTSEAHRHFAYENVGWHFPDWQAVLGNDTEGTLAVAPSDTILASAD